MQLPGAQVVLSAYISGIKGWFVGLRVFLFLSIKQVLIKTNKT